MLEPSKITQHDDNIARVRAFLSGEASRVFADLEATMRERAHDLDFEEAQKIKETITALR